MSLSWNIYMKLVKLLRTQISLPE